MSVENFEKEEAVEKQTKPAKGVKVKDLPDLPDTPDETPVVVNQFGKPVKTGDLTPHSLQDDDFIDGVFSEMEKKTAKEAQELTSDYLDLNDFEVGEERNYIFTGMGKFTKPDTGEVIPAVHLLTKERRSLICASTLIVQSLTKVEKLPCAVRIQVNGKKKGKNGSYFDVRVFVF